VKWDYLILTYLYLIVVDPTAWFIFLKILLGFGCERLENGDARMDG